MRKSKINDAELKDMLEAGRSQKEAAEHFGVTEGAISQRVKALGIYIARNVADRACELVSAKFDALAELNRINAAISKELDWLSGQIPKMGTLTNRQPFQDQMLKCTQEIRGQIKLQVEIFRVLYDIEEVAAFQQEVLNAIEEADPGTRERIVQKLHERRAIRSTIQFDRSLTE